VRQPGECLSECVGPEDGLGLLARPHRNISPADFLKFRKILRKRYSEAPGRYHLQVNSDIGAWAATLRRTKAQDL